MVEENEKVGCFNILIGAALLALIIGATINGLFGAGTLEFGDIFIWTFFVVAGIASWYEYKASENNKILRKASRIEADRILAEEKEKGNTQDE